MRHDIRAVHLILAHLHTDLDEDLSGSFVDDRRRSESAIGSKTRHIRKIRAGGFSYCFTLLIPFFRVIFNQSPYIGRHCSYQCC